MTDEQMQANNVLRWFAYAMLGLGGLLLFFGIYFVLTANSSRSWPSVEGAVILADAETQVTSRPNSASNTRTTEISYYVGVMYGYEVEGESYVASRISLGDGGRASEFFEERSEAEAAAAEMFPAGSPLTVYYDPDDPASAVLNTGWNWGTFVPLILGLFLAGVGGLFLAFPPTMPDESKA